MSSLSFNEEMVARAVAASRIPVVSAVGHETDFSICDFVADMRAPTPSAAAEIIMPEYDSLIATIDMMGNRMRQNLSRRLNQADERLRRLVESRQLSDPLEIVRLRRERVQRAIDSRALSDPYYIVESRGQYLDLLESKLGHASINMRAKAENRLNTASAKLDALSPLKVLGRGYALVLDETGRAVQSATQAKPNQALELRLHDGRVRTTVTDVELLENESEA